MRLRTWGIASAVWLSAVGATAATRALVIVPIADLRSEPSFPPLGVSDDKQLTQLLFGESVRVYESSGDWVRVEAIEQPSYKYHQRWEGYPGWVLKSSLKTNDTDVPTDVVTVKWLPIQKSPRQSTFIQLPLGAHVQVLRVKDNYSQISLMDGHVGWADASGLKKWATATSPLLQRDQILNTAALLIGDPYVWGGRSPFDTTHRVRLSGVDCSGLVSLSFLVNGVTVPRDSMEQYMKAEKITRAQLKPADLIFSALPENPQKIVHVMFYAGNGMVLEGPKTGLEVRRISFKEKTGVELEHVESGQTLKDRVVYFGRFLKD